MEVFEVRQLVLDTALTAHQSLADARRRYGGEADYEALDGDACGAALPACVVGGGCFAFDPFAEGPAARSLDDGDGAVAAGETPSGEAAVGDGCAVA